VKKIKISSNKQENGLWGIPLRCSEIDYVPFLDKRKLLIFSASLVAVAEYYNDYFKIFNSTDESFLIKIGKSTFKVIYEKYEVEDNILYEFENDDEHKNFIRKQKIIELNKKVILENIF